MSSSQRQDKEAEILNHTPAGFRVAGVAIFAIFAAFFIYLALQKYKQFVSGTSGQNLTVKVENESPGPAGAAPSLPGKRITVHYEVFLSEGGKKGKKIDSSRDRNTPFDFLLGTGQVFAGWDKAMEGSNVGTKREVLIPAELAYGKKGVKGLVPPDTDLFLEYEVLSAE